MDRWQFYNECICISSEVVSFRIEIYDNETGELVAKVSDMVNRKTRNGSMSCIVKCSYSLSPEIHNEIHKECLKRMKDVGL